MGASGTFVKSGNASHPYYTLKLYLNEKGTSVLTNESDVEYKLSLVSGSASFSLITSTCKATINSVDVISETKQMSLGKNSTLLLKSGTIKVKHNADGKKDLKFSFSFSQSGSEIWKTGTISSEGTLTLTTISRQSSFGTVSGNTIGSNCTVKITRNNSAFTHQLWYKVGNSSWYNLGNGISTAKTFTIDMATCSQFPSKTSGIMQIRLRTFNGSAQIGSDVYKDLTVNVPDTVIPTASATFAPSNDEYYIQRKNGVTATFSNVNGAYGSTVSEYVIEADGKKITSSSANVSSGALRTAEKLKICGYVVDSRGRASKKVHSEIDVCPYAKPTVTAHSVKSLVCKRCLEDGTLSNAGTYLHICASAIYYPLLKNENDISLMAKLTSKNGTTELLQSIAIDKSGEAISYGNALQQNYDAIIGNGGISIDKTYKVELIATDTKYSTASNILNFRIPTKLTTFHLRKGGSGAAFGKYAERKNALEIDSSWDLYLKNKPVNDFICDEGDTDGWHYIIYSSNTYELLGRWDDVTITFDTEEVSGAIYSGIFTRALPDIIASRHKYFYCTDANVTASKSMWASSIIRNSADQSIVTRVVCPTSSNNQTRTVSMKIHLIGELT